MARLPALLLASVLVVPAALGQAGALDPSFGDSGRVALSLGLRHDVAGEASAAALQPDGRLVVVGWTGSYVDQSADIAVARFGTDGVPDSTFGVAGIVVTRTAVNSDRAFAVAIQADGKIVVVGHGGNVAGGNMTLVRYHPDGTLDAGFGSGGVVRTDVGAATNDVAYDVVLHPDGRIVVAGRVWSGTDDDFVLARYLPDGALDPSFGSGGVTVLRRPGAGETAAALALRADGRVVVAGTEWQGNVRRFAVARFTADGVSDPTFGTNGFTSTTIPGAGGARVTDVALYPDGRVVVAGDAGYPTPGGHSIGDFVVVRYLEDGALDDAFGTAGLVHIDFGQNDEANATALLPDGRILVGGGARRTNGSRTDVALLRLRTDGSPDPDFGEGGLVRTPVGVTNATAVDVLLLPDGRVVAAGNVGTRFTATRYAPDGALDPTFGAGGVVVMSGFPAEVSSWGRAVVVQPDGRIVVGGRAEGGDPFTLVRLLPDGALDPTFGTGGVVRTSWSSPQAVALVLQPDGRIVATGGEGQSVQVARYLPDGALDPSFGSGGTVSARVTILFGEGMVVDGAALQPDGGVVVVGTYVVQDISLRDRDVILVRFTAAGVLDPTFGAGGIVMTDLGSGYDDGLDVAVQPDGRVVVAGRTFRNGGLVFALLRYQANGVLDPAFGQNGVVTTRIGMSATAYAVRLLPGGRIVLVGSANLNGPADFALARYLPDGTLDPSFGDAGVASADVGAADEAWDVAVRPDGRIVAGGYTRVGTASSFALAGYRPDGTLDPAFGSGGLTVTGFGSGSAVGYGLALQADGRIVVGGTATEGAVNRIAVARYLGGVVTPSEPSAAPSEFSLDVGPNPVRGGARVPFGLPTAVASVHLALYDALGREVAVLADGPHAAGRHEVALDAAALAPGVYLLRLVAGAEVVVRRVSVTR